jgi:hypothetical protein
VGASVEIARLLAREGKISTNELARRARAAGIKSAASQYEAREFERTKASAARADH